jgi:ureidoacrylate peracid hydrolase
VSDANADHTDAEHNATLMNFCVNFGDVAATDDLIARLEGGVARRPAT